MQVSQSSRKKLLKTTFIRRLLELWVIGFQGSVQEGDRSAEGLE